MIASKFAAVNFLGGAECVLENNFTKPRKRFVFLLRRWNNAMEIFSTFTSILPRMIVCFYFFQLCFKLNASSSMCTVTMYADV